MWPCWLLETELLVQYEIKNQNNNNAIDTLIPEAKLQDNADWLLAPFIRQKVAIASNGGSILGGLGPPPPTKNGRRGPAPLCPCEPCSFVYPSLEHARSCIHRVIITGYVNPASCHPRISDESIVRLAWAWTCDVAGFSKSSVRHGITYWRFWINFLGVILG